MLTATRSCCAGSPCNLLGASGLLLVWIAASMLIRDAGGFEHTLPIGLPWLRWHLRLDPLGAFFPGVIGLVTTAVSIFGPGYVREYCHGRYS